MLGVYAEFAEQYMAMPVIQGEKTAGERFPGAVQTYCIEAMMQDRKALQAGTSHFLGQNFAKASGIQFTDENNALEHAWTTSWGVSTRLIGGMIMTHADDDGMVLPAAARAVARRDPADRAASPRIAQRVLDYCQRARRPSCARRSYAGVPVRVELDDRDLRGGDKLWQWIKKGVPLRLEIGPRDIEKDTRVHGPPRQGRRRRRRRSRAASSSRRSARSLQEIQDALFARAKAYRDASTRATIDTKDEFYAFFAEPAKKKPNDPTPIHGGFALTHFDGDPELEAKIKDDLKVTVRCIPLGVGEPGTCPFTGQPSKQRVVWAKSY